MEFIWLGLVFVAYIFGVILSRIEALREAREKIQTAQDKIVEFCSDLNMPDKSKEGTSFFFFFLHLTIPQNSRAQDCEEMDPNGGAVE